MSRQASSSPPSLPVITRAGRVVTSPRLYANEASVAEKNAASSKSAEEAAEVDERKTKKRAFEEVEEAEEAEEAEDVEEEEEEEEEDDSSGDEFDQMLLLGAPDFGRVIMDDSSDGSESSGDTVGYCPICDRAGPAGLMCNASGCEDSNGVYQ